MPPDASERLESSRSEAPDDYWRALLHRWFVTYNPFYLVSALLVLAGLHLVSNGLSREPGLLGRVGVAALAELYAFAAIGGAALLMRRGQARPAVMLGILALLYQVDLTLHTETCAAMGAVGASFALPWLVLFGVKLAAIAWALHVRLSRRTWAVALTGAVGLVALPFVLVFAPRELLPLRGYLVGAFVFALGALAPRNLEDMVTSTRTLDAWGSTVLRRVTTGAAFLFGAAFLVHSLVWSSVTVTPMLLALFALFVARRESEKNVWILHGLLLVVTVIVRPGALSPVAAFAVFSLVLRAFSRLRTFGTQRIEPTEASRTAYRTPEAEETPVHSATWASVSRLEPVAPNERARLFAGALTLSHLVVWTFDWRGGALPAHSLLLDLALLLGMVVLVVRRRAARPGLVPVATSLVHGLAVSGLVPIPQSSLGWGAVALSSGFALLFASVATSAWLAKARPPVV